MRQRIGWFLMGIPTGIRVPNRWEGDDDVNALEVLRWESDAMQPEWGLYVPALDQETGEPYWHCVHVLSGQELAAALRALDATGKGEE